MKIYMQSYKEKLDFIEKSISSTENEMQKKILEKLLIGYQSTYKYMLNKIRM
ncbi:hypothetical protein [Tepidibacter sp. Z1-5]|uniref:hypothetical protein n=1 Tax=Tepidibacter sp. Z1-5 TaxID=3134138 RepID=UPI0030BD3732